MARAEEPCATPSLRSPTTTLGTCTRGDRGTAATTAKEGTEASQTRGRHPEHARACEGADGARHRPRARARAGARGRGEYGAGDTREPHPVPDLAEVPHKWAEHEMRHECCGPLEIAHHRANSVGLRWRRMRAVLRRALDHIHVLGWRLQAVLSRRRVQLLVRRGRPKRTLRPGLPRRAVSVHVRRARLAGLHASMHGRVVRP